MPAPTAEITPSARKRTRARKRLVVVIVGVENVQDVDAVEAKPLEALLERVHDSVVGEVEHRVDRWHALKLLPGFRRHVGA